jgi:uncharacterized Fe-S cluster protein YjdI
MNFYPANITDHHNSQPSNSFPMKDITRKYSNGELTVVWKPKACTHSTLCWRQLRDVFNPVQKPWIQIEGANTEKIIQQVNNCPSGALSYYLNNAEQTAKDELLNETKEEGTVEVLPKGPLLVHGSILVKNADGQETRKNKVTAFCRCGASANKPYCDGSHNKTGIKEN